MDQIPSGVTEISRTLLGVSMYSCVQWAADHPVPTLLYLRAQAVSLLL